METRVSLKYCAVNGWMRLPRLLGLWTRVRFMGITEFPFAC